MAAYNSAYRLVPETSRYTLEELENVFNQRTDTIIHIGLAQIWCLLTLGWIRRHQYPELVTREADRGFDDLQPVELKVIND